MASSSEPQTPDLFDWAPEAPAAQPTVEETPGTSRTPRSARHRVDAEPPVAAEVRDHATVPGATGAASALPSGAPDKSAFLTDREAADRYRVTRQTIWRWARGREGFPRPVQIAPGTTRWRWSELRDFEAALGGAELAPVEAVETAHLTDRDVADRYRVSRQTIWRWGKSLVGFPAPIQIAPGTTRWRLSDLRVFEAALVGAGPASDPMPQPGARSGA